MTVLGGVRLCRAYYYCPHCGAGHCPRDTPLGLAGSELSRGATEAVALAGALSSFAEAARKTLPKLAGLRVGESTVERTTERTGADVGARLAEGRTFGTKRSWAWSADAEGKSVAYVSADATGVGMQGTNGAAAEGRMAAVGMIWNAGKPGQVRYVCGLTGGLSVLGHPLRNQARRSGWAVPSGGWRSRTAGRESSLGCGNTSHAWRR